MLLDSKRVTPNLLTASHHLMKGQQWTSYFYHTDCNTACSTVNIYKSIQVDTRIPQNLGKAKTVNSRPSNSPRMKNEKNECVCVWACVCVCMCVNA